MATFLLEVGVEELPAQFVDRALAQWQHRVTADLSDANLAPSRLNFYGTPRRLAIYAEGLPDRQPDRLEDIKGPPAQAAFKDGKPTRAAEGFAQKQGVSLEALEVRPTEKGEFVFVEKTIPGRRLEELLTELAPQWILGLEGKRFMRWGDGELRFSRPIRWLVSVVDDRLLPLTLENGQVTVHSDRVSQGHRVLHPEPITIDRAQDYVTALEKGYVLVDVAQRRDRIREQILAQAAAVGGIAEIPEDLLAEVTQLVEWPTAVVGDFETSFLKLPPEVITMVMITHQRYFPIRKPNAPADADCTHAGESLFPHFITLSNGDPAKAKAIAAGNGRVIRARLADGEFFYKADCKQPLEAFLPQLDTVTFQEALGSLRRKVDRIVDIAAAIVSQLEIQDRCSAAEAQSIQRAALLCKADLVSQMVFEFPELQGVMGQKYALVGQESPTVATAIREHYLPKGAGDELPQTLTGQVVGLADRLDTLVCIFGLGLLPTGSSDPFALRRAANAIVNILWAAHLPLNLGELLAQCTQNFAQGFPQVIADTSAATLQTQLEDFFLQRLRTLLQEEQGLDYDLVNAVLGDDVAYRQRALSHCIDVLARAKYLQALRQRGDLDTLYETINRATRLAQQGTLSYHVLDPVPLIQPDRFQQPTEQALYEALMALLPETQGAQTSQDYDRFVAALLSLAPTVRDFFDGENSVMVMDADPAIRENRLNLLGILRNHGRVLADFGAIVKA